MAQAAPRLADAVQEMIRHVLRLLELEDRHAARDEITALLEGGALSPALRTLLEAMLANVAGDHDAAVAKLSETFRLDPRSVYAHFWLAQIHFREGRIPAAIGSVERALEIDNGLAEGWFLYGALALGQKDYNLAMHCLVEAVRRDVDNHRYWHRLNQWLPRLQISGPMPAERSLLLQALRRQKIEFQAIGEVIYPVLKDTAGLQQLMAMSAAGTLHEQVLNGQALGLLDDELVLLILRRTILHHAGYEKLLTGLRHGLLDAVAGNAIPPALRDTVTRFTSALAIYALTTEFVFHVTGAESRVLAACRERLDGLPAEDPGLPLLAAVIACYEPLSGQPCPAVLALPASPANRLPEFREMVQLHVLEPMQIRARQAAVESFGRISNAVSLSVQRQYEENPYPRWRFLGEMQAVTFDNRISRSLPHLRDDQRPRLQALPADPLDVLIAGCGTGRNALSCGREYPSTRILAVDLSRASLAYAGLKAEELGIGNIEFRQGDILDLPGLGRQFDFIESIGVLHHMEDPARGLAALARCLRPGGWMKIALYSRLARHAVRLARRRIAEQGYPSTAEGIRGFRHAIFGDRSDQLHELCARWRDFFSLSECRDLLFHVQEHQFTTRGLEELVAGAGLEFMGFEADPESAGTTGAGVADRQSLRQWGEFEEAHPDFFGSMYVIWLRKPA